MSHAAPESDPRFTLRDLVDALFLAGLMAVALYGFRSTFSGWNYAVAGAAGIVLALGVVTLVTAVRWPVWPVVPLLAVVYYLFGGVVVLRDEALGRVLPTGTVLRDLSTVLAHGWKRLLTTLPPVAATGELLAVPFVIGLLGTALGACAAQRSRSRFAPAVGPVLALAATILLGTAQAPARLWQGIAFGCGLLCWAAVRRPGGRPLTLHRTPGGPQRLVIGALVLAIAGVGSAFGAQHLPGNGGHRLVLRTYVKPPFDIAAYPSPLVGFRAYTKSANQLYDHTLFTVRGLRAGAPVRLATLDDYDGLVWGATNGTVATGPGLPIDAFQRVGSQITSTATGPSDSVTVTIANDYAATPDIDAWVPTAGVLRSIDFTGADATSHAADFRYDLATGAGITSDLLQPGDTYRFEAADVVPAGLPKDAQAYGTPTLPSDETSFVSGRATQWSAKAQGLANEVLAVARAMRGGAYSDGGPGETEYLPGHSVSRITTFLNAPQLVGDDEQYAAAFALICNYLGMPARVVLIAEPEADGVVRGSDVHTSVELHVRTGATSEWVTIGRKLFMPSTDKKPDKRPPQTVQNANAAVVPPPNPVHPPSTLDQPDRPDQNTQHLAKGAIKSKGALSGWTGRIVYYAGIPIGSILLICLLIGLVKWQRRFRRRRKGPVPHRFDAGWREFVDWARDLGAAVPVGRTRGEQAAALRDRAGGQLAAGLAVAADAGVFGPGTPPPEAAVAYWREVDAARRSLARSSGRFGRVRATLNLRSLRRPTRPVRTV